MLNLKWRTLMGHQKLRLSPPSNLNLIFFFLTTDEQWQFFFFNESHLTSAVWRGLEEGFHVVDTAHGVFQYIPAQEYVPPPTFVVQVIPADV